MAERKRVMLEVIMDLDPIPGAQHTAEDAKKWLEAMLLSTMPHYNPIVMIAPEKK